MDVINYISVKQNDGYITKLTHFSCPNPPKASILILHGMAEHQKRYFAFAEYLLNQGFDVYLYNHRGHGSDKKFSDLGFFAPLKGSQLVVDDAIMISEYIVQNNRSNKFFIFGHSMGSLIARNIIQVYDKYQGIILTGTTHPPKLLIHSFLFLTWVMKKLKGPKHVTPYINNLMVGSKKFTRLSNRTAFDWLSRSNPVVGAYIHDPYCGFTCTTSFYNDFVKLIANATRRKLIKQTKKDLPLYIISGEKDPVGGYGKEVKKFISVLNKMNFSNVSSKLYPECRHELLNEVNKEEVYHDIYQWLMKRL